MPGIVVKADDAHRDANERRLEELEHEVRRLADAGGRLVAINDRLAARVADLEQALAEAIDTWTPLAQCDSMQEGDELTAFERRARALLAGPGGA